MMDTRSHSEVILAWRRKEQHSLGYWINLDDSRVLLGHQVGYMKALTKPQRYGSRIDVNQGVHLIGSDRCASTI
jgi:hypothetical protein